MAYGAVASQPTDGGGAQGVWGKQSIGPGPGADRPAVVSVTPATADCRWRSLGSFTYTPADGFNRHRRSSVTAPVRAPALSPSAANGLHGEVTADGPGLWPGPRPLPPQGPTPRAGRLLQVDAANGPCFANDRGPTHATLTALLVDNTAKRRPDPNGGRGSFRGHGLAAGAPSPSRYWRSTGRERQPATGQRSPSSGRAGPRGGPAFHPRPGPRGPSPTLLPERGDGTLASKTDNRAGVWQKKVGRGESERGDSEDTFVILCC